jgi:uncharacterized protein
MVFRYLDFLSLPSSIATMSVGVGLAAAALYWLSYKETARALLEGLGASIGTYLVLLFSDSCWQSPSPAWFGIFCVFVGLTVGTAVAIMAKRWRHGLMVAICGIAVGLSARFILEIAWRSYALIALKYSTGYALTMVAPVAVGVLYVVAMVSFVRAPSAPSWLLATLVYVFFVNAYLFASPLLSVITKRLLADLLIAAFPCAVGIVVLGALRRIASPVLTILALLALYSCVGILLLKAASKSLDPMGEGIRELLLVPTMAWSFCVVLTVFIALTVYRLTKHGLAAVNEAPLWVVLIPWVSLAPAYYFVSLGKYWVLLFILANLILGVGIAAPFALRFGALRLAEVESGRTLTVPQRSFGQLADLSYPRRRKQQDSVWRRALPDFKAWSIHQRQIAKQILIVQLLVAAVLFEFKPSLQHGRLSWEIHWRLDSLPQFSSSSPMITQAAPLDIQDSAADGDLEKVRAQLKANADLVYSKDAFGRTPLHWAAIEGHKEVAELLLASRAEVDARNSLGATPLHVAALNGRIEVARLLLDNQAAVDARSNDGTTALQWAAGKGHKDMVELLLASKAGVNGKNNDGETALDWAAKNNYQDVVELLRQHGGHE